MHSSNSAFNENGEKRGLCGALMTRHSEKVSHHCMPRHHLKRAGNREGRRGTSTLDAMADDGDDVLEGEMQYGDSRLASKCVQ